MMFQTLHILLFLTAVAMITERVTAACLKMKLKEFRNRYNTVQNSIRREKAVHIKYLKPLCCERGQDFFLTTPEINDPGELKRCPQFDKCDHTIHLTYAVNGTSGSTGWAGTVFGGHTKFGNWIGDIDNNNIRACSELQRKVYSDNSPGPGGQQRREEWVMPDVDVSINVNDVDAWPHILPNDFVTHFKARIHPMHFAPWRPTLCLYANFEHRLWRMTYRPDQGCPEAPYWIKIDFELETTKEEGSILAEQFSRDPSPPNEPFCTIVENNQIYGCMQSGWWP